MKKILLVLSLLVLFASAFAQTDSTRTTKRSESRTTKSTPTTNANGGDNTGFRFGLQFSPEIAWMKAQDKTVNSSSPAFGFSYGLMFDYNIARRYAFSTGIYVTQVAASLSYNVDSNGIKFNSFKTPTYTQGATEKFSKIQYIEIPLSIKLKTNEIGYMTYFGQFGVQGGFKIKVRGDISDLSGVNNKVAENLGPDISPANVSLLLGAGLEYSLSAGTSAYAALNFVNGFLDATRNPAPVKSKVTLNQLALRVGIFF